MSVKIVGVGNAGTCLIDRFTMERTVNLETVAVNTDLQSLAYSIADRKISIGKKVTHGLGTGSHPELGREAALESQEIFQSLGKSTTMIIVCAGLGGGTASGALPILLEMVRRTHGVLTVAVLTLPFSFEGERRMQQAMDALVKIRSSTDAILVFENNRISEMAQPAVNIWETFAKTEAFLIQVCTAIAKLIFGTGPIQTTPRDLAVILRPNNNNTSIFGVGEAYGEHRAYDAIRYALKKNPMDLGRLLYSAESLLLSIDGPSNLLLSEVHKIIQEVLKFCNAATRILLGVQSVVGELSSVPVTVSLLGTCSNTTVSTELTLPHYTMPNSVPCFMSSKEPKLISTATTAVSYISQETSHLKMPPSTNTPAHKANILALQVNENSTQPEWQQRSFDPMIHGSFKSIAHPIVEGEDTDIPTFLRLRIRLK